MMIFRWIVRIRLNPAGFFAPGAAAPFLAGISRISGDDYVQPVWSADKMALYSRRRAMFLVSELRRVGYNVRAVPYVFYQLAFWIRARKQRLWK